MTISEMLAMELVRKQMNSVLLAAKKMQIAL